jgi:hypothetical protein
LSSFSSDHFSFTPEERKWLFQTWGWGKVTVLVTINISDIFLVLKEYLGKLYITKVSGCADGIH